MVKQTMITAQKSRRRSRAIRRPFLKEKARWQIASVMQFEDRLASGPKEICDLFAEFI
jgi:hypothetical protein